ncbi:MAG: flagellar assembly protein T N-terminal domain-containing protein [Myxococcota bacterium]
MKAHEVLAAALVLAVSAVAAPEYITKESIGEAAIVDGNEERAEREAKERALRNAVEEVAGVLVSADTLTQNSQLLSDRIFAHSAGYVRKYDVVSKKKDKGVVLVTVKAEVGTAQLDKDLQAVQALIKRLGQRKLVLLLQEQTIHSTPKGESQIISTSVAATVLTELFKKDGWTVIDPSFAAGKLKVASGVSMTGADAKEIGDLTKAEYILYGNVVLRNQEPGPHGFEGAQRSGAQILFPVTGEYDLTVFATDSGSQLAKVSGALKVEIKGSDGQLRKTVAGISYERTAFNLVNLNRDEISNKVRAAVVEYLRAQEQNGNRVVMHVTGLADFKAVQDFKKAIAALSNVRDVKPGTFGKGKAEFDISYAGRTEDLADVLSTARFKKKKLQVTGVSANTVEVQVAK